MPDVQSEERGSAMINSALPGFGYDTTINLQNLGEGAEVRGCIAGYNPPESPV
jgi:hypothetical protein